MRKILFALPLAGAIALSGCNATAEIQQIIVDVQTACGIVVSIATTVQPFINKFDGNIAQIVTDICSVVHTAKGQRLRAATLEKAIIVGVPIEQCFGTADGIPVCGYVATPAQMRSFMRKHGLQP